MGEIFNPLIVPFDPLDRLPARGERDIRRVKEAVEYLNESLSSGQGPSGGGNYMTFSYNEKAHKMVVKVLDRETGEVVYQLPPNEVLRMASVAKRKARQCGSDKGC